MGAAGQGSEESCAAGQQRLGAWLATWAPGEPLLPPPPPHWLACSAPDWSHTAPNTLPLWPPGPSGIRPSVCPGASTSLSILLLCHASRFPLHSCSVLAELLHPAQTGWTWWSWGPSAPRRLQHGQDCAWLQQAGLSPCCPTTPSVGLQPVYEIKWEQHDTAQRPRPLPFAAVGL